MRILVLFLIIFTFCGKKEKGQQPYIINLIQDTCDMLVPLRLRDGELVVVWVDLHIENSKEFSISDKWFLNHTKLTMQDAAKEYWDFYCKEVHWLPGTFSVNSLKRYTNDILQRNLHPTLDKQGIQHDKIFPSLRIIKVKVIPSQKSNDYDYYSKKIYE